MLVCAVMVSACTPNVEFARPDATSGFVFTKAGATEADYNADKEACRERAVELWKGRIAPYGKLNQERQATNNCMIYRGWEMVRNRHG